MTLDSNQLDTWRDRLGRLGVWAPTDAMDIAAASELATTLDELGYGALWLPETLGRDPFAHVAHLATKTERLIFATGIANIHHRLPGPMMQATNTVSESSGNRFALAMGVSHAPLVEGVRKVDYGKPLATMRAYLEGMDASPYMAAGKPDPAPPRLLAALGPKMLELAASHADGAHPYWSTPAHTAIARDILGAEKLLCPEQKIVRTTDAEAARQTAIGALAMYITLPNYRNNWLRLGFTDEQIDSHDPEFLDAVVAWGDDDAIAARIAEHHDAGADHVCVQALTVGAPLTVDVEALRVFAPE